jgi:FAD/FMN-containing dehydrogenase
VGTLKVDKLEHHKSPVALGLMRSLKTAFDPHNLMNPGKLLRIQYAHNS